MVMIGQAEVSETASLAMIISAEFRYGLCGIKGGSVTLEASPKRLETALVDSGMAAMMMVVSGMAFPLRDSHSKGRACNARLIQYSRVHSESHNHMSKANDSDSPLRKNWEAYLLHISQVCQLSEVLHVVLDQPYNLSYF